MALVVSLNVMRRNLSASQKAVAAASAWQMAEDEGRVQVGAGQPKKNSGKVRELIKDPRAHFSGMFAVNEKYVEQARAILSYSPELAQAVRDGAKRLDEAAREVKDETLYRLALDIKIRANRQAGELLKQLDARGDHRKSGDAPTSSISQREAAEAAGLSKDQQTQAVAISNVPREQFESELAKEKPPTLEHDARSSHHAGADIGRTSNAHPRSRRVRAGLHH